ncbi:MAG: DUF721 domain-containing protein [Holosporales bacterium]|jgi:hypothetical protein|nr:DUF721 domain-containing protein [Holosporales bacterium]
MKKLYYEYSTIGQNLKKAITPIYKKHGFFRAELILDWEKIVGPQFAMCRPVRISELGRSYILYVAAPKSVAVQMVYFLQNILERIHQYLGNKSIREIKFVAGNIQQPFPTQQTLTEDGKNLNSKKLNVDISYAPLKTALEKLAQYF